MDQTEASGFIDAVRQGLKESEQGLGRPAEDVFQEMKTRYGLIDSGQVSTLATFTETVQLRTENV